MITIVTITGVGVLVFIIKKITKPEKFYEEQENNEKIQELKRCSDSN